MPWCEVCAHFWNPSSMGEGGTCPTCGQVIVADPGSEGTDGAGSPEATPGAPWHFKLLVVALVVYLGYRAVQGVAWVVAHI
jgi:hypothetical protein